MEKQNYELVYKENFIKKKEYTPGGLGPDEQDIKDSMEYKQVATCGEKVLKFGPPAGSQYHVSQNFEQYVLQNKHDGITNTWGGFATVFLVLSWYSWRILRSPWRKSFFKVKTYGGHYQYVILRNFSAKVAESLMERLGFIYHKSQQAFLFHPQSLTGPWREQLSHVGMDFFLVHVRCAAASAQSGRTVAVQDTITLTPAFSTRGIFPKPIPDNYVRALPMNHSAPLVGLNQPMKHRRAPTSAPDWSRIEAVPPIPWQHRRKPKMTQQISEEDELYAAADESLEKIHYPPPVDEVHPQLTMDEHIERAMRDLQTRNNFLPLEAMFDPNQSNAAMFDPNQRGAAMFDPNQSNVAMFDPNQRGAAMFDPIKRGAAMFDPIKRDAAMFAPNQQRGNYVTLFPRPPAEGKDSNENIYQEI